MEMFTTLNGLGCDCQKQTIAQQKFAALNGLGFVLADVKGKWITSPKSVSIYDGLAGKLVRKTTPNGYIGKVYGANQAGTWIELTSGYWILNDASYTFATRLTQFQLDDYAKNISSWPRETAQDVKQEVEAAVDANMGENPIEALIKKYALPAILIAGGIYLAATYGKAFIQGKLAQPRQAVAGLKRSRKKSFTKKQLTK